MRGRGGKIEGRRESLDEEIFDIPSEEEIERLSLEPEKEESEVKLAGEEFFFVAPSHQPRTSPLELGRWKRFEFDGLSKQAASGAEPFTRSHHYPFLLRNFRKMKEIRRQEWSRGRKSGTKYKTPSLSPPPRERSSSQSPNALNRQRQLSLRYDLDRSVPQVTEEQIAIAKRSAVFGDFPTNKAIVLLAFNNIPNSEHGLSVKQLGTYAMTQEAFRDKYDSLSRWRRVCAQTLSSYPKDFRLENGLWKWISRQKSKVGGAVRDYLELETRGEHFPSASPPPPAEREQRARPRKPSPPSPERPLSKRASRIQAESQLHSFYSENHGEEERDELEPLQEQERFNEDYEEATDEQFARENPSVLTSFPTSPTHPMSPPVFNSPFKFVPFKKTTGSIISED